MKRNIVESYSIEEAFRALNKKPQHKVVESASAPVIPAPYDKYFDVLSEKELSDLGVYEDEGMFQIGEKVDGLTILAYLGAKAGYKDMFDSWYFLVDDVKTPVVELVKIGAQDRVFAVTVAEDIVEIPGSKLVYPEFFADQVEDFSGGYDKLKSGRGSGSVHKYYIDKGTPRENLIITKMFATSEWVEAAEEYDDYGIIELCGYQLANGDYLYCDASTQAGDLFIKCKDYDSLKRHIISRNGGSLYPEGEFVEENVKKAAKMPKVVESASSDYYAKVKSETRSTNTLSDFIANVKLMQDVLELDDIADFYDSFEAQIYDQFLTIEEFINNNIPDATSWNLNHEDNEVTVVTPDGEIKLFIEADDGAGIDVDFIDESLNESVSTPKIPAPYDKYFEIVNYSAEELEGMASYLPGEVVEEYNAKILAFVDPKDGYEDIFDSIYYLVDEEGELAIVELQGTPHGTQMFSVDLADYGITESDDSDFTTIAEIVPFADFISGKTAIYFLKDFAGYTAELYIGVHNGVIYAVDPGNETADYICEVSDITSYKDLSLKANFDSDDYLYDEKAVLINNFKYDNLTWAEFIQKYELDEV